MSGGKLVDSSKQTELALQTELDKVTVYLQYLVAVLWIRIRIGSVFRSFLDPDTYSHYGFGSSHVNIG